MEAHPTHQPVTAAGLLIALGIIFGDIGTSPLYVFKAILGQGNIDAALVYGGLSCIFWTLTLQTTLKYVVITIRAHNKGEGGVFALYTLIRRQGKWVVLPAMLGGAALLADGMITPAITISSAVEGLGMVYPDIQTVPIVLAIIIVLFSLQRFGTAVVGRLFGPVMLIWFLMMAVLGILQLAGSLEILRALSPHYAVRTIVQHPEALLILGAVFLCTTGAEALYSDLGHCGLKNIRISWIYVKTCLLLGYFGQGAWLLKQEGTALGGGNPFYLSMPECFIPFGIGIATLAAIIASQAMISGSFTLVAEAVRLNMWPKVKIMHPSHLKGQIYVPSANRLVMAGCMMVVLVFQHSSAMEAAYGLAINLSFLVTTMLMGVYLYRRHTPRYLLVAFLTIYLTIEVTFLVGNVAKIPHGGWLTLAVTALLLLIMAIWWRARKIKNRYTRFVEIEPYLPLIAQLSADRSIPVYASQLVYLTSANFESEIEQSIVYSIIRKKPKRAVTYWLVHVHITDAPYTGEYRVTPLIPGTLIRIDFRLGFRDEHRISLLFRQAVGEMVAKGEISLASGFDTINEHGIDGDFRFVVLERVVSAVTTLSFGERIVLEGYHALKLFSLSEEKSFGLDPSFVTTERVPLFPPDKLRRKLKRV